MAGVTQKALNRVGNNSNSDFMKKYQKPQVIAKNKPTGSYAAGCPAKDRGNGGSTCRPCELSR